MRRVCLAVVVVLGVWVAPAAAGGQSSNDPAVRDLLAADQSWITAFTKCDLPSMDRLIGSDLTFVNLQGALVDKPAFLKIVGTCTMDEGVRESVNGRILEGNVGNVIGRFRYRMKNQASPAWQVYNRTYIKRNGAWQLVSASHTASRGPEAAQ